MTFRAQWVGILKIHSPYRTDEEDIVDADFDEPEEAEKPGEVVEPVLNDDKKKRKSVYVDPAKKKPKIAPKPRAPKPIVSSPAAPIRSPSPKVLRPSTRMKTEDAVEDWKAYEEQKSMRKVCFTLLYNR